MPQCLDSAKRNGVIFAEVFGKAQIDPLVTFERNATQRLMESGTESNALGVEIKGCQS